MEESTTKKRARYTAIFATLLYLALFFPSFYVGLIGSHISDNSSITGTTGTIMVFASILVPLMLIASVIMIWGFYFSGRYRAMYVTCLIPPVTAALVWFFMRLLVA